jgi:hypothetical protein
MLAEKMGKPYSNAQGREHPDALPKGEAVDEDGDEQWNTGQRKSA